MDGTIDDHARQNKSDSERKVSHLFSYTLILEKRNTRK